VGADLSKEAFLQSLAGPPAQPARTVRPPESRVICYTYCCAPDSGITCGHTLCGGCARADGFFYSTLEECTAACP
jgi:hypothetical protein